ncbi:MAG: hypothetical protein PHS65_02290 [Arcobacteraceae bacterium]|nr:hypothetical protein [Arcobacteraceae bacterium]
MKKYIFASLAATVLFSGCGPTQPEVDFKKFQNASFECTSKKNSIGCLRAAQTISWSSNCYKPYDSRLFVPCRMSEISRNQRYALKYYKEACILGDGYSCGKVREILIGIQNNAY